MSASAASVARAEDTVTNCCRRNCIDHGTIANNYQQCSNYYFPPPASLSSPILLLLLLHVLFVFPPLLPHLTNGYSLILLVIVGRGCSVASSVLCERRIAGSNPNAAATLGFWASPSLTVACIRLGPLPLPLTFPQYFSFSLASFPIHWHRLAKSIGAKPKILGERR